MLPGKLLQPEEAERKASSVWSPQGATRLILASCSGNMGVVHMSVSGNRCELVCSQATGHLFLNQALPQFL